MNEAKRDILRRSSKGKEGTVGTVKRILKLGGFFLLSLHLMHSVAWARAPLVKCSKIQKLIEGNAFDIYSMQDTYDKVEGSKFINDNSAVVYFAANASEEISTLYPFTDVKAQVMPIQFKIIRNMMNARCVLKVWQEIDESDLEYFEISHVMNDASTIWFGNMLKELSQDKSEAFFYLEMQSE
jgi:hypothetical protein